MKNLIASLGVFLLVCSGSVVASNQTRKGYYTFAKTKVGSGSPAVKGHFYVPQQRQAKDGLMISQKEFEQKKAALAAGENWSKFTHKGKSTEKAQLSSGQLTFSFHDSDFPALAAAVHGKKKKK